MLRTVLLCLLICLALACDVVGHSFVDSGEDEADAAMGADRLFPYLITASAPDHHSDTVADSVAPPAHMRVALTVHVALLGLDGNGAQRVAVPAEGLESSLQFSRAQRSPRVAETGQPVAVRYDIRYQIDHGDGSHVLDMEEALGYQIRRQLLLLQTASPQAFAAWHDFWSQQDRHAGRDDDAAAASVPFIQVAVNAEELSLAYESVLQSMYGEAHSGMHREGWADGDSPSSGADGGDSRSSGRGQAQPQDGADAAGGPAPWHSPLAAVLANPYMPRVLYGCCGDLVPPAVWAPETWNVVGSGAGAGAGDGMGGGLDEETGSECTASEDTRHLFMLKYMDQTAEEGNHGGSDKAAGQRRQPPVHRYQWHPTPAAVSRVAVPLRYVLQTNGMAPAVEPALVGSGAVFVGHGRFVVMDLQAFSGQAGPLDPSWLRSTFVLRQSMQGDRVAPWDSVGHNAGFSYLPHQTEHEAAARLCALEADQDAVVGVSDAALVPQYHAAFVRQLAQLSVSSDAKAPATPPHASSLSAFHADWLPDSGNGGGELAPTTREQARMALRVRRRRVRAGEGSDGTDGQRSAASAPGSNDHAQGRDASTDDEDFPDAADDPWMDGGMACQANARTVSALAALVTQSVDFVLVPDMLYARTAWHPGKSHVAKAGHAVSLVIQRTVLSDGLTPRGLQVLVKALDAGVRRAAGVIPTVQSFAPATQHALLSELPHVQTGLYQCVRGGPADRQNGDGAQANPRSPVAGRFLYLDAHCLFELGMGHVVHRAGGSLDSFTADGVREPPRLHVFVWALRDVASLTGGAGKWGALVTGEGLSARYAVVRGGWRDGIQVDGLVVLVDSNEQSREPFYASPATTFACVSPSCTCTDSQTTVLPSGGGLVGPHIHSLLYNQADAQHHRWTSGCPALWSSAGPTSRSAQDRDAGNTLTRRQAEQCAPVHLAASLPSAVLQLFGGVLPLHRRFVPGDPVGPVSSHSGGWEPTQHSYTTGQGVLQSNVRFAQVVGEFDDQVHALRHPPPCAQQQHPPSSAQHASAHHVSVFGALTLHGALSVNPARGFSGSILVRDLFLRNNVLSLVTQTLTVMERIFARVTGFIRRYVWEGSQADEGVEYVVGGGGLPVLRRFLARHAPGFVKRWQGAGGDSDLHEVPLDTQGQTSVLLGAPVVNPTGVVLRLVGHMRRLQAQLYLVVTALGEYRLSAAMQEAYRVRELTDSLLQTTEQAVGDAEMALAHCEKRYEFRP